MILHDVTQGTPEWIAFRLGIVTGSCGKNIFTPKGEPRKSKDKKSLSLTVIDYLATLTAERLLGQPLDEHFRTTSFMQRGTKLEDDAIRWAEMKLKCDIERVGGVSSDDGKLWVSPDGLIGDDGGCEVKCLSAKNHIRSIMQRGLDKEHLCQVQMNIMVSGRKWWKEILYNPAITSEIFHVERDDEMIAKMEVALDAFDVTLEEWCVDRGVPSDWRERIAKRMQDRAAMQAEDEKYFPQPEVVERADADKQREFFGRKHATETTERALAAFEAGGSVQ